VFLLACSYWFYSQVDIKMTVLLIILTLVFWLIGKRIHHFMEQEDERKAVVSWSTWKPPQLPRGFSVNDHSRKRVSYS
jgi:hypothetical protein